MARVVRQRLAAAAAWGTLAGAASYPLQRLYSAWVGEVPYAAIFAQEHVPYYWRVVLALFHTVLVAILVGMIATEEQATASLSRIPLAVGVVLGLALVMVLVP